MIDTQLPPAAPTAPLRAVIVDDTDDLRELLRIALVRGGVRVVGEARDGLAGIAEVRSSRPDVILLDLSMPVMDGLAALPVMRELAPEARIIVLSGFGANAMAERALAIGADAYLQKGASIGRILDLVRDGAGGRDGGSAPPSGPPPVGAPPGRAAADSEVWSALDLAPFGVVEVEPDLPFRILRVNPAGLSLLGSPDATGQALGAVARTLTDTISDNRRGGDLDFESAAATGPVQVSLRHTAASLLLYLRPITDEVRILRNAIATTAHELRGPVSVLAAVAETLSDAGEVVDPDEQMRLMASIARQSRMLDSITADLLTEAQIQRGALRIDSCAFDPLMVADALVQDRYAGTVVVEVEDDRQILADPLRFEQMLGNLISNAHKYGAPPVVVRIRASREHRGQVCIDVQDSGTGVPVDFRLRLFSEFTRASGTVAAGTGLGLHVVHTLAEAQGGSICYAPAVTGGAMFTLTMPAALS